MFEEILKEVSGANNKVVAYESKNESNKDKESPKNKLHQILLRFTG